MSDCVGKPFTSAELWHCLMKYFTPLSLGASNSVHAKNAQLQANLELHKKLQTVFVESNKDRYNDIIEAMEKGDIDSAHRFVHSLKSNAGQVGKSILQKAAAEIECKLKNGKNLVTEDQMKILKLELNMVLNEFSSM